MATLPYGSWPTLITSELVVRAARAPGDVAFDGRDMWWSESRPEEGGRIAVLRRSADGVVTEVLTSPWNARTAVHEYGGGSWWVRAGVLWFADWATQRVHRLGPGDDAPVALTPAPEVPRGVRYADGDVSPDGSTILCVQERHAEGAEAVNTIVRLAADEPGEAEVVVAGPDFVSTPRWRPDGKAWSWLEWNHPDMPWDATRLVVSDGATSTVVAGAEARESICQAAWAPDGSLWFSGDRSGFWSLYRWTAETGVESMAELGRDVGFPHWVFGESCFAFLERGRVAFVVTDEGLQQLGVLERDGGITMLELPHTSFESLRADGSDLLFIGASPTAEAHVVTVAVDRAASFARSKTRSAHTAASFARSKTRSAHTAASFARSKTRSAHTAASFARSKTRSAHTAASFARSKTRSAHTAASFARSKTRSAHTAASFARSKRDDAPVAVVPPRDLGLDPGWFSSPEPLDFPTADGATAHALVYWPRNPTVDAPSDERPPLLVMIHGGPTAAAQGTLRLGVQYWTSRGFAVVDVNYRGSTGYGRAYRDLLQGQWGVADVEDCAAVARFLVERGDVDPDRLCIRGGSAGGFTVLAALAFEDVFSVGTSYYGVADLAALATDTHKFESRYLDGLIGAWPAARDVYAARSPINHTAGIVRPLCVFQGLEDEVVPPNQSQLIVDAVRAKGVPVAYVTFAGEQHGFRQAANIRASLDGELSFYAQVLGFDLPADEDIEPIAIS